MVRLPFLNRRNELGRIERAFRAKESSLVVVYGRRRLGKSRLVQEALRGRKAVYYVGDERDGSLQREGIAREIDALVPSFSAVTYRDWWSLLERFWRDAPAGAVLTLDEFPSLVGRAPELPGLLQKLLDRTSGPARHVALTGSSQRMMHGLALDASAPLYGRAREVLRVAPLPPRWLKTAFSLRSPRAVVEHFAIWGGVPRYWELARAHASTDAAVRALVLDPLGVLHDEPARLLADDLDDPGRASSILALIGAGAHRVSEIAGRLGRPSTDLARPLAVLVELGLVVRETPFGVAPRDSKRSFYRIADPFLRYWFRFVAPNRSRLAAGQIDAVAAVIAAAWPGHLAGVWEDLARASVARAEIAGTRWKPAGRLWGNDTAGAPFEVDVAAESIDDPNRVLLGEVKLRATAAEVARELGALREKASRIRELAGKRLEFVVWVLYGPKSRRPELRGAADVIDGGGDV